jgi:predicted CoA-binding protein
MSDKRFDENSGDACPLPSSRRATDDDSDVVGRLTRGQKIAVVGLSDDTTRAAWMIADFLLSRRLRVFPVNPHHNQLMGLRCYPTVSAIDETMDVVDVFRRAEFCPETVRDAIAAGAKGIWLQSSIISPESRHLAERAGIDYVENRCLMVEMMHGGRE